MKALVDDAGRITLPHIVQTQLGVKQGDELAFEEDRGKWYIKPSATRNDSRDWCEYEKIENSRMARELNRTGGWLDECLVRVADANRESEKREQLKEIDISFQAAKLFTTAWEDMVMCAKEYRKLREGAFHPEDDEAIRHGIAALWPCCNELARIAAEPLTNRMTMEKVSKYCSECTTKGPQQPFAPVRTMGRRSEMLGELLCGERDHPNTRTFLGHSLWYLGYRTLRSLGHTHSAFRPRTSRLST